MAVELPAYLKVLWSYRPLVAASAVLAVLATLLLHFRLDDGALTLRADREYSASVTVLLGGGPRDPYYAEIPGTLRDRGMTPDQAEDLSSTAAVYAYLVSGAALRDEVVGRLGPLGEGESIGGVRRTTKPQDSEGNGGRYSLPILAVVGVSLDPDRAVELSRAATSVFLEQVARQQDADAVPVDRRVTLTVTDESDAVPGISRTAGLPVVATGLGAFVLALAGILVGHAVRQKRARRGVIGSSAPGPRRGGSLERSAAPERETVSG